VDPETRFREVFELAYAPLCRYARHRGLSGPDAQDLVAQTMEIAWRRIEDVPAAEPLPWLYAVAHNVWRNTARRDRRRRELLARFRVGSPDGAYQDPGGLDPGALRAALASLRDDDQEILRLVAWDGLAPADIAVVLGCSPNAARTRLHRARSRLAARLGIGPDLQRYARAHKQGGRLDSLEVR
jgi:RNA polymerase sigma-70 factor (ECF subfamily)